MQLARFVVYGVIFVGLLVSASILTDWLERRNSDRQALLRHRTFAKSLVESGINNVITRRLIECIYRFGGAEYLDEFVQLLTNSEALAENISTANVDPIAAEIARSALHGQDDVPLIPMAAVLAFYYANLISRGRDGRYRVDKTLLKDAHLAAQLASSSG